MAGETTSVAASAANRIPQQYVAGVFLVPFTLVYATGQLELNDVMEAGYLPSDTVVHGFLVKSTDMDTNGTPTLAQKITVGSTDLVTGITAGQSAGQAVYACTPTTLTAKTLVSVTNTAAAATAAAGTLYIAAICQRS